MSAFCHHIEDYTSLFVAGYELPHFDERRHITVDPAVINPHWANKLAQHGLRMGRVELFYGPPDFPYTLAIHTDTTMGDRGKLNWVIGGEGCTMHWYRVVTERPKERLPTQVGSVYNNYEPDEVECIHTTVVKTPSLVQAGIPHNIVNPGQERWCYSMVVDDPKINTNATFRSVKKVFEQ